MLSVDTGIPIVPVGLVGTFGMLKKGTWAFKNQPLEIRIGNPIHPKKFSKDTKNSLAEYVKNQVTSIDNFDGFEFDGFKWDGEIFIKEN